MQRLVICSDVHGFYDELMEALDKVNFNSESDLFISLGDNIDRGPKPKEVINFMLSLPNKVLIKGNHCDLFETFCTRGYPLSHDWSNGTADSILSLAPKAKNWKVACAVAYEKVKPMLDIMVDYYETKHYIFTHGYLSKGDDWRYANSRKWEQARWFNGIEKAMFDYTFDKCVVVGHYHTSWGHAKLGECSEFGEDADFSPFYYKDKLIAIDGCTVYTHKVNVLVLEDELLEEAK